MNWLISKAHSSTEEYSITSQDSMKKNPPAMQETPDRFLRRQDPLRG